MNLATTRRNFLGSVVACGFGPPRFTSASAQGRSDARTNLPSANEDYFAPMIRLVRAEGLPGRGSLALARVERAELLFVSDDRHASDTLWKPGSTVKPFLLEHLIDRSLLRADETLPCSGAALPFAGRRLDCSHARQSAALDPATALALSCNRCFLRWAERLDAAGSGASAFAETLRRAGFSLRHVFGRNRGVAQVSNPRTREAMLLQALGEADVVTTPLALLESYRRLLLRMAARPTAATPALLEGMRNCIRAGTGVEAGVPGVDLAGKTGTATSPDRRSLNGWMLSFWPSAAPRLLLVVCVEGGRGGAEAAPIAGNAWRALGRAGLLA